MFMDNSIIEIGRELTAVKADLPHGQFLPWIKAEFEMGERTAQRFMYIADRFGFKSVTMTDFKPTILYALAAPSTPDSVYERFSDKSEIISDFKPTILYALAHCH